MRIIETFDFAGFGRGLKTLLLAGAGLAAALTGCVRDGGLSTPDDPIAPGQMRISFAIDGMEDTRSIPASAKERTLEDAYILFFTQSGDYITYQHASVTPGSSSFTCPVPDGVDGNVAYRTLIIGNAQTYVPDGYKSFDDLLLQQVLSGDYDAIKQNLYSAINSSTPAVGANSKGLPMWGEMRDYFGNPCDFTFTGDSNKGYIVTGQAMFWRSVCRFDLKHLAAKQLVINRVKMVQFRKGGYYFHQNLPWADTRYPDGDNQLGTMNEGVWIDVAKPSDTNTQEITSEIYAYPNMVPIVVQNDKFTTYLMIEGYYQDPASDTPNTTKLTYYRFNMAKNGGPQLLQRNHYYQGIINHVSGPGADNEQSAADASAPMLDYNVNDTWDEEGSTTVTDDNGNFLSISRGMVTFLSEKDLAEVVQIKVKDGLSWTVEWDKSSGDWDKFSVVREDDQSFSIHTLEDNNSQFLVRANLIVRAAGGSVDPSRPLTSTVSVIQMSSAEEVSVLLVDNNTGELSYKVPGVGATMKMVVQTGSARSAWTAIDENNQAAAMGVTWNNKGANGSTLEVCVPTNISDDSRTFQLTVYRLLSDGTIDESEKIKPVTLTFTQPKSDVLLTVTPKCPETTEGLVFEGFDPTVHTPFSGLSAQQQFIVNMSDPSKYTYTVTSSFNKDYDLFLSKTAANPGTTQAVWTNNAACLNKITGLKNGEPFWVNIFRTGPGDPSFTGTITVTLVPIDQSSGAIVQSVTMTITVKSSCVVNDVLIPDGKGAYLLVADRNTGAPYRIDADGNFVTARNFTNDANVKISYGNQGQSYPDNTNNDWKGMYSPWTTSGYIGASEPAKYVAEYWYTSGADGSTNIDDEGVYSPWYKLADQASWKVPTKDDLTLIQGRLIYSKQRAFIVSDVKDKLTGKYIGCYFPFAGQGSATSEVGGYYWSSNPNTTAYGAHSLTLTPTTAVVGSGSRIDRFSVRCVRAVTAAEFDSAQ